MKTAASTMVAVLLVAAATLELVSGPRRADAPQAPPVALGVSSGFKITYGLKQKINGRGIAGVVRNSASVRSITGWHLDVNDRIVPPDRWELTLRTVANDTPEKGVILD